MLDRSTIIGFLLGFTLIFAAIALQGSLSIFLSLTSLLIVVGGLVAATMVNYSFENIKDSFSAISSMMGTRELDLRTDMELLSMFARRVRKEGLLVLDGDIKHINDSYLKNSLQLAVDGFKRESLDSILRDEIRSRERQVETSINVMHSMSTYAPAFGMIGTVIGMVLMLQNIEDPQQLGLGLSVALLTTLYGTVIANMILGPLAGKLEYLSELDINRKEMFRAGILSMVEQENPRIMEKKMLIYVDPQSRAEYLKYHEGIRISKERDEKFYKLWIEQQNKEWDDLKEILETG
ncbi:MAG: MotA/TolQ/ExbB proton channel family protein [Balneolaceae bacterium]|nr:MotA/TolQ/ExbB proton channel family protein [Balneolaceae bacterium]MCH8547908.1 MotA/TolQ/ExbB proton channel family protein [Balneolaceae bacterium]